MDASWKTKVITVPSGTGSVAYTGLGGRPKALIAFATNWLTEDAVVTTTGTAVMRGMCCGRYDSPSTLIQSCAVATPGDQHVITSNFIQMLTTGGSASGLFAADVVSLDADGFTLNWTQVASGGYKVVIVALMGVTNAAGFIGTNSQSGLAFGFKAAASLIHGAWGGPSISGTDRSQEWFGGGAYPGPDRLAWTSAGLAVQSFPTAPGNQYNLGLSVFNPDIVIVSGQHFTGPFLTGSNIIAFPSGTGLLNMDFGGDSTNGGMLLAWDDDESWCGFATVPTNTDDQFTESGLAFAPGLLIGYCISDEPGTQGSGSTRGAIGFSVVTPDFQWCCLVDVQGYGSYQSFARGFVDHVTPSAVHTGDIELTNNGFVMTTVDDDTTPQAWAWHAFGFPKKGGWVPQIYRRVIPG